MTPKEKAKELIDKMSFETHKYNAISCALIAVDEIVNAIEFDFENTSKDTVYWLRVKQEIEKL